MDKDKKQIDEMSKDVFELGIEYIPYIVGYEGDIAEYLINKGYCKASDVAKEIGDEIAKNLMQVKAVPNYVAIEVHTLISIIEKYKEPNNERR